MGKPLTLLWKKIYGECRRPGGFPNLKITGPENCYRVKSCCARYASSFMPKAPSTVPVPTNAAPPTTPAVRSADKLSGLDSSFSTSQYGITKPIIFGSDKITGNVIWKSDFFTHDFTDDSGSLYEYVTVDFALALCEGPINGVIKIWLGDVLIVDNSMTVDTQNTVIPGVNGIQSSQHNFIDPESPLAALPINEAQTEITVYTGEETQLPAPEMVEALGIENTPAYRGMAYILFKNFVIAENSVPDIFVEVSANTEKLIPKIIGTPTGPLVGVSKNTIMYNVAYNSIMVAGAGPGTTYGPVRFNGNTLEQAAQFDRTGLDMFGRDSLMTSNNIIISQDGSTNSLPLRAYNPYTDQVVEEYGYPSNSLGHTADNFGRIGDAAYCHSLLESHGMTSDIMLVDNSFTEDVGFLIISSDGNFYRPSPSIHPGVVQYTSRSSGLYFTGDESFKDGKATKGLSLFSFHAPPNLAYMTVSRFDVGQTTLPFDNITHTIHATINNLYWDGPDAVGRILTVFPDKSDNTFILLIRAHSISYLMKYDPVADVIRWRTELPTSYSSYPTQTTPPQAVNSTTWAYIGITGKLVSVNLVDGVAKILSNDITAEGLPPFPIAGASGQFYNGYENSITYITLNNSFPLVKIYLDRITRKAVTLPSVLNNLLTRVGYRDFIYRDDSVSSLTLHGYTIRNRTPLRAVMSELAQVFKFDVIESNGVIKYVARGAAPSHTIPEDSLIDVGTDNRLQQIFDNNLSRADKLTLTYSDLDREYGENVQNAEIPSQTKIDFAQDASIDIAVPVTLTATEAKSLAEIILFANATYNKTMRITVPQEYLTIDPADTLTINMNDGRTYTGRARDVTLGANNNTELLVVQEDPDIYAEQGKLFGDSGSFAPSSISNFDPLVQLKHIPIPYLAESSAISKPGVELFYFAPLMFEPGTLSAPFVGAINGVGFSSPAPTKNVSWGYAQSNLLNTTSIFTRDTTQITVDFVQLPDGPPVSITEAFGLANPSANLALIGDEIVQYHSVIHVTGNRYVLTNFTRGVYGSDSDRNISTTTVTSPTVVLLDALTLIEAEISADMKDGQYLAEINVPSKNPLQVQFSELIAPLTTVPWSPSNVSLTYVGDDIHIAWQRRARFGGQLADGTPVVPQTDWPSPDGKHILYVSDTNIDEKDSTTYLRTHTTTSASAYVYTLAQQVADGFDNTVNSLYVTVTQMDVEGVRINALQGYPRQVIEHILAPKV